MRRVLASTIVAMAVLTWAWAPACSDPTPPASGDLPGDRGSIEGPVDAGRDAREASAPRDADVDADADTLDDGG